MYVRVSQGESELTSGHDSNRERGRVRGRELKEEGNQKL